MGLSKEEIEKLKAQAARRTRFIAVGLIGFMALVCVVFFGGWWLLRRHGARNNAGKPSGAVFVDLANGKHAIAVIDDSGERTPQKGNHRPLFRIATIDLATGEQLGFRIVEDYLRCWTAATNRLWCHGSDEGTLLLDATTLDTIAKAEDLVATLGKPLSGRDGHYNTIGLVDGGVIVRLNDGRSARVDTASLAVTPIDEATKSEGVPSGGRCRLERQSGDGRTFSDGTRQAVIAKGAARSSPPASAPRFLQPEFLVTSDQALTLIQHRATLDSDVTKLSRLDGDRIQWTADVGACQSSRLDGTTLVMATFDTATRVIAIDTGTGARKWTFKF